MKIKLKAINYKANVIQSYVFFSYVTKPIVRYYYTIQLQKNTPAYIQALF